MLDLTYAQETEKTNYCFTGPRNLTYEQSCKVERTLINMRKVHVTHWLVGDAPGLDELVANYLRSLTQQPRMYRAEGKQPWQLAARSKAMVDGCAALGNARLIAYPNKPCPAGVKPSKNFCGKGSGTWGTIAYAKHLGMEIQLIWLTPGLTEPDWMRQEQLQLSLF